MSDRLLYQEHLMDHYRHPRCQGTVIKPDFSSLMVNPACGDTVSFSGSIENGIITCIRFTGQGCVISQAMASILAEHIEKKPLERVFTLKAADMFILLGMDLGPVRARCALLSLEALQKGLEKHA